MGDASMRETFAITPGALLVVVGGVVIKTTTGSTLAPSLDDLFFVVGSWHEMLRNGVRSVDPSLLILHLQTCALVKVPSFQEAWWLQKT